MVHPTDYAGAFKAGYLEVKRCDSGAADGLCFLSAGAFQKDVTDDLLASSFHSEDEDEGVGASGSGCVGGGGGAGGVGGGGISVEGDDRGDTDNSRLVNNPKGQSEMKGFKALGFRLEYNGNSIEKGIDMYEKNQVPCLCTIFNMAWFTALTVCV